MQLHRLAPLFLLLLCACDKEEIIPVPDPVAANCGDSEPTITNLEILDAGMQTYPSGTFPAIDIKTTTHDDDGDLHYYQMHVWWDEIQDDTVDTARKYSEIYGTLNDSACEVLDVTLTMRIAVTGNPPYDEELEFGVLMFDDMDHASDGGVPTILNYTTPDAEGNYR